MNKYYKVPISYYHLYLKKDSKDGIEFTKKKLCLYENWKRQLVLLALKFKILPRKKINSNADIIFLGNRKKEFYFNKKIIITYGDCKKDYETRVKMNKYFNCIKNPRYSREKLEEDLIWPTKKITEKDVVKIFEKLIEYYKKNLEEKRIGEVIKKRVLRHKNSNQVIFRNEKDKFEVTKIHGDFWIGNLEKDYNENIWVFDWGQNWKGLIVEDFVNYFLIEFFYTRKINKRLFLKILSLFIKRFKINYKEMFVLIKTEIDLNKINRPKEQWNLLEKFKNEVKNLL